MPINYAPILTLGGFDNVATPKFQMVPKGRHRRLRVTGFGPLRPRIQDSTIATISFKRVGPDHFIDITGIKAGTTFIEWVPNPAAAGVVAVANRLEVCVKEELRINTAFHYVHDNAGHRTRRNMADLDTLRAGANSILDTQANARIYQKSKRIITVPANLGAVVRFVGATLMAAPHNVPAAENEWDDITAFADAAADFNVFFVWEYEQDATPGTDNANAGTIAAEKNCIIEDHTGHSARTLAHETVHLLGHVGHVATVGNLMGPTAAMSRSLNRQQIRMINPSGN